MRTLAFVLMAAASLKAAEPAFNGRWDISVPNEPRNRCWWLKVEGAGTSSLKGEFVGAPGGQLDPIPEIAIVKGELVFTFRRSYDGAERKLTWRARLDGDKLQGTFTAEGLPATTLHFTGVRAPAINESSEGWRAGKPVQLFNGRDLAGWHSRLAKPIGWRVEDGMLNNGSAGVPDRVLNWRRQQLRYWTSRTLRDPDLR